MSESENKGFNLLTSQVLRYLNLQLDYARLTVAEKLSVLLSTIAFMSLAVIIGMATLFFISIGVGHMLAMTVSPIWAYLLVSAFYLLLFVILIIFRKQIIVNPVSRMISRLFVKAPEEQ